MQIKHLLLALTAGLFAAACSDDDTPVPDPVNPYYPDAVSTVYVLNQGSQGSIDGSLDALSLTSEIYTSGLFLQQNKQSLGDSPQQAMAYGSKLYVAVFGSNLVWVLDKHTARIVKSITVEAPEGLAMHGGYVYVAENTGKVARIDTASLNLTGEITVGPNPAKMAVAGEDLLVTISDGYNWENEYANGFKVARVDTKTFTKTGEIAVGMNPGEIIADPAGNAFVVCMGNYGSVAPKVWKISEDGSAREFCDGSDIAYYEGNLYVVNNYTNWYSDPVVSVLTYKVYNAVSGAVMREDLFGEAAPDLAPVFMDINPATGHIYLGTDAAAYDYTSPGYLYRYDHTGQLIKRYRTGTHPCGVAFAE